MRTLLALLGCLCAAVLFAATDHPKIDGKVDTVSQSDIRAITVAAKRWLRATPDLAARTGEQLVLIHILDRNKAEAHFAARNGKVQSYFVETVVTVQRVRGSWKADDEATVIGADKV
jgi:hypothetical protein